MEPTAKQRYEIINPSDELFFDAPSLEIAAAVVVLLGQGQYGGEPVDGGERVPIFLFGGHDDWYRKHFDCTVDESLQRLDRIALAEAMESVALPEGRERTSLNDIARRARAYAQAFRAEKEEDHA